MRHSPTDPLRAQLLELITKVEDHTIQLRDFGTTPGNAWLAKSELQATLSVLAEVEGLLEDIKQADAESGY